MSIKGFFIAIGTFFLGFIQPQPKVGTSAPDFVLYDQAGTLHKLSALRGKKVALCFYPKDNTPGCTKEMCNLRDDGAILADVGVVVLGISFDGTESHKKFSSQHKLTFPILSDVEKKVGKAYGTKQFWLPVSKRVTFLIDEKGNIAHVINSVDVNNHAQQIKKVLGL